MIWWQRRNGERNYSEEYEFLNGWNKARIGWKEVLLKLKSTQENGRGHFQSEIQNVSSWNIWIKR